MNTKENNIKITSVLSNAWNKWENLIASIILWLSKKTRYNVDNKKTGHFITHPNKSANIFQIFFNAVLKRKIMLFSILVTLISLPVLYLSLRYQSKTEAAWYNDQWTYRQTVAITNSGSAQTDYQVSIGVGTSALVVSGKMQSDCDDIRITDIGGKLLSYWIEPTTCNNASNSTTIWVKTPSIPTSGTTLYVYYGNPSATSGQAATTQVFIREVPNLEGYWDAQITASYPGSGTTWSDLSGNGRTMTYSGASPTWSASAGFTFNGSVYFTGPSSSVFPQGSNARSVVALATPTALSGYQHVFHYGSTSQYQSFGLTAYGTAIRTHTWSSSHEGGTWSNSVEAHVITTGTGSTQEIYKNGVSQGTGTAYALNTGGAQASQIGTRISPAEGWIGTVKYVQIYSRVLTTGEASDLASNRPYATPTYAGKSLVRKSAATEPSVASPTNEEKTPGPVAYWTFNEGVGSTAYDSTLNGNNVSLGSGSSAAWVAENQCVSGKCLQFANSFINNNFASVNDANSLDQSGDFSLSTWFKTNTQPTSNSSYKVLVVEEGSSGTNLKTLYSNAGYNIVGATNVTTVAQVAAYSPDIVLCDAYVWSCSKSSLLNSLYDAGYTIVSKGNDNNTGIRPIATSHSAAFTNKTVAPDEKHPIGNGWSTSGNSGTDTGWYIDTVNSSAVSIARDSDTIMAVYLEEPNKGRWFHYQHSGTIDSTLFTNMNAFLLRYNILGKGKNYNLYTYNGNLYGFVNNQKLSGAITYNTWNHASLVYDQTGGNIYLYLNGKQLASQAYSTALDTDSMKVIFGTLMKGFIDETKLYPYARSAAQIKTDYTARGSVKGTSASMGSNSKNSFAFSDGLVGYWKMDESTTSITDSSGNNHTTTPTGSAMSAGKFGNSFDFNGTSSDYAVVTDADSLDFTTQFTVSAWIYRDADSGTYERIISKDNSGGTNFYWYLQVSGSDKIQFGNNEGENNYGDGNTTISTGKWYHVVGVYDGTQSTANDRLKIYVNGNSDKASDGGAHPTTLAATTGNVNFGRLYSGGYQYSFNGKIDEVRLYNRALSPKEASDLYNWAPGPYTYLNFEEGTGTAVNDASGNGFNANWSGTGTHWAPGKFGKAAKFDGSSDYITFTSLTKPAVMPITIEFWVNPATATPRGIFDSAPSSADVLRNYNSGYVEWWNGTPSVSLGLTASTWQHIALVYNHDGTNRTIAYYKNGVLQTTGSGVGSSTFAWTANSFQLGRINTSDGWFSGSLDEFKIYNYARTQKQIVEDMNAGHPNVGSPVGSAVGYWKFDEGADNTCSGGTNDVCNSGNGGSTHDGAQVGMSVPATATSGWTQSGKFGKGLNFDGSGDYVNLGSNKFLYSEMTISLWANNIGSNTNNWPNFIMTRDGDSNACGIYYNHDAGENKIRAFCYIPGSGINQNLADANTTTDNNWHHIVAVFSTTLGRKLYKDGILVASDATYTGSFNSLSSTSTYIGLGRTLNAGEYYKGTMDEVKIYNYALTEDEIKLDYNRGSAMVLGTLSVNTGNTAPPSASSQEYCVPGDSTSCASPVGEWTFNEGIGSTVNDTSGNANIGYWNGTGSHWTNGKVGKAGNFNGSDDYVNAGTGSSLNFGTGDFSIESWIKYPLAGSYVWNGIISKGYGVSAPANGWGIITGNPATGLYYQDTVDAGGSWNANYSFSSQTSGWHHIAVTRTSGTSYKFYVDGRQNGTQTTAATATLTNGSSLLFANSSDSRYLNGSLDNIKIFNYARTPAQIAWDYNRGAPVGWWKLDESQGSIVYDSSGVGNTGTITIGASGTQTSIGTGSSAGTAWGNGVTGKLNYSLNLDGTDDYVNITDNSILRPGSGDWSVSIWAKPANSDQTSTMVSKRQTSGDYEQWGMSICGESGCSSSGQQLQAIFRTSGSSERRALSSADVADGNWHHYTMVVSQSANKIKLYKDGTELSTSLVTTGSWPTVDNTDPVRIGDGNGSLRFSGQVDDVRVYNYALTEAQIKNLYNGGAALRFGPSTGSP